MIIIDSELRELFFYRTICIYLVSLNCLSNNNIFTDNRNFYKCHRASIKKVERVIPLHSGKSTYCWERLILCAKFILFAAFSNTCYVSKKARNFNFTSAFLNQFENNYTLSKIAIVATLERQWVLLYGDLKLV